MKNRLFYYVTGIAITLGSNSILTSCNAQSEETHLSLPPDSLKVEVVSTPADELFANSQSDLPSVSVGTVSNGSIENARIMPFSGPNFHYFDSISYINERGFAHDKVVTTLLTTYDALDSILPGRHFCVMECSNKHGGAIYPHRTHQNGLSVDLMMPKLKNDQPYYGLDSLGGQHYFLTFDSNGKYEKDPSIEIDFNTIALHLLLLQENAKKVGMSIEKVIINTGLKDELFATAYGRKLKSSGIYVVQNLSPLINSVHDDHYHVDFKLK